MRHGIIILDVNEINLQQETYRDEQGKFLPGHTGNPEGRPQGSISLVSKLRQYLIDHPSEANKVIEAMVKQGKFGNMIATKEMFDRIDGKVIERHILEGTLPVTLVFKPAGEVIEAESIQELEANQPLLSEAKD